MAKLTLSCPHCGGDIDLPATVVHTNSHSAQVLVKVDQSVGEAHLAECRAKTKPAAINQAGPSTAELTGRVDRVLAMRAYIAVGGSRACTMCGTNANVCMEQLQAGSDDQARVGAPRAEGMGSPCCNVCGSGNTHPAPGEAKGTCAEWAADFHEGQQQ